MPSWIIKQKMQNRKLDKMVLTNEDIVSIISNLISLVNSKVDVDDIDHLSVRRSAKIIT